MNTLATREVRRATPADAEQLARLRYAFRSEQHPVVENEAEFHSRCVDWMRARLADHSCWRAWVLQHDGELVGNVWVQRVEKIPNPGREPEWHAYLSSFFVVPKARNSGGGSRLIMAALDDCRHQKVDTVFLWPTARSRSLYQRHGFRDAHDLLVNRL